MHCALCTKTFLFLFSSFLFIFFFYSLQLQDNNNQKYSLFFFFFFLKSSGNVQGMFGVCSEYVQSVFRVYSEYVQSIFRVGSGYVQGMFRVCSGYVQSMVRVCSEYQSPFFFFFVWRTTTAIDALCTSRPKFSPTFQHFLSLLYISRENITIAWISKDSNICANTDTIHQVKMIPCTNFQYQKGLSTRKTLAGWKRLPFKSWKWEGQLENVYIYFYGYLK